MITVPKELLQAIHEYLMTKPMIEVEGIVLGIRQCKPSASNNKVDEKANNSKS